MKGGRDQGVLDELVVTTVLSIFKTIQLIRLENIGWCKLYVRMFSSYLYMNKVKYEYVLK